MKIVFLTLGGRFWIFLRKNKKWHLPHLVIQNESKKMTTIFIYRIKKSCFWNFWTKRLKWQKNHFEILIVKDWPLISKVMNVLQSNTDVVRICMSKYSIIFHRKSWEWKPITPVPRGVSCSISGPVLQMGHKFPN